MASLKDASKHLLETEGVPVTCIRTMDAKSGNHLGLHLYKNNFSPCKPINTLKKLPHNSEAPLDKIPLYYLLAGESISSDLF